MDRQPNTSPQLSDSAARPGILPFHERRKHPRRPLHAKATVTLLDGPGAGQVHQVLTRDLSLSGLSFYLKVPLAVGQNCRIEVTEGSRTTVNECEVVRSRPLSTGRHEMGVKFRTTTRR
jgi:hypothetical protein